MIDYEKMYYIMFNATERAINILIEAQQKCEEICLSAEETKITPLFPFDTDQNK